MCVLTVNCFSCVVLTPSCHSTLSAIRGVWRPRILCTLSSYCLYWTTSSRFLEVLFFFVSMPIVSVCLLHPALSLVLENAVSMITRWRQCVVAPSEMLIMTMSLWKHLNFGHLPYSKAYGWSRFNAVHFVTLMVKHCWKQLVTGEMYANAICFTLSYLIRSNDYSALSFHFSENAETPERRLGSELCETVPHDLFLRLKQEIPARMRQMLIIFKVNRRLVIYLSYSWKSKRIYK